MSMVDGMMFDSSFDECFSEVFINSYVEDVPGYINHIF